MEIKHMPAILFATHDRHLADIYKQAFEREGVWKLSVTHDEKKTIADAKKKHPHVILLDAMLDTLDGFATLDKLKSDSETGSIPVIMLTRVGQKEDVDRAFALGAEDYILTTHARPADVINAALRVIEENRK